MAGNNTTQRDNAGRDDGHNAAGHDSGMRSRVDTLSAPVAGSETNQQEGAGTARQGGFPSASPESNVNPPGAPQSSHGSATEPIPGGTVGAEQGEGQSSMGAAAAGGNPGTTAGTPDGADEGGRITGVSEGDEVEKLAEKDEGGAGGADSR